MLGEARERFARHGFQGANFFMLAMLERYRGELGVVALPQELSLSRQRTLELLRTSAATLSIARAELRDGRLEAEVVVTNTAGHKLPTAYPSRRVWLRFVVSDADGRRLFSSGALRPDGSIEGNDNDRDPLAFEPHHRVIETADQVQIYESIMVDARGRVTTGLLTAVRYAKDNRLLPRGLDKAAAGDDYAVRGEAKDDPDFQGGGDRVVYRPRLPAGAGRPLPNPGRASLPADRLPLGAQPRGVPRRSGAGALRSLLRSDVHRLRDDAGLDDCHGAVIRPGAALSPTGSGRSCSRFRPPAAVRPSCW